MKNLYLGNAIRIAIAISLLMVASTAFSQLKIGTNPTQIHKSSLLELESDRQGFLLPRLTDTMAINTLTPPDGMLIYLAATNAANRGLYIRKNGIWQRMATDSSTNDKWSKQGDQLIGNEKLGSLNAQTLRMITNNIERMTIDGNTGNVTISQNATVQRSLNVTDTTTTRRLIVSDSVRFQNLNRNLDLVEVLVIDTTNGSVQRRGLSPEAFRSWIVGPFSNTTNPYGISKVTGANGTDTLKLHAASATTAGGVSITTQTFGGNKTFQDSVTAAQTLLVGKTGTANSNLQVEGSVSFSIKTITANTTLSNTDYTVLVNAASNAVTVTLPTPSLNIIGRTYIIKKIAGGLTNDVIINGPIEDGNSISIYNDWTVVKVQTDGNRWYIIK